MKFKKATDVKNILLITVDCFRYDRCGFNGYSKSLTTPTLDRLASESFVFDQAIATGQWTAGSFPGILAGRLSSDSAYQGQINHKAIPNSAKTIASNFSKQSFNTVGVVANPTLTKDRNWDTGFDSYINLRLGKEKTNRETTSGGLQVPIKLRKLVPEVDFRAKLKKQTRILNPYSLAYVAYRGSQIRNWPTVRGEEVVNEFLAALNRAGAKSDSRIFGWTHLMDPHAPIHPATADAVGQLGQTFRSLLANACQSENINSAYYEKLYDYSLMYVDTQLNRIIDQLKDWSIWDETALVITGDHGEALYDRGLYGHPSHYLYNELLHVPLLTRVPGFEGERLYRPFSLGWLHELMADVAGINRAELPLTSSINDHRQSDAEVAAQPVVVSDSISKNGRTIAVQSRDVKIVKTELSPEDEEFNMSHQNAVYNISTDPLERHRLSISKAPQYLETTIEKHEQSDNFPKPLDGYMSDEVQDKLRDLGYL